MSGMVMAVVAFAGPANASDAYPPPQSTTVLGTTATVPDTAVAGVSASTGNLAFTGSNALGIGALGGLLLVGGGAMVVAGRRRKADA
jgi:hypothetical protein